MKRLSNLFDTDPVTGLYSSIVMEKLLSFDIERAKRYKQDISIALFEIDDLSASNGKYNDIQQNKMLKHFSNIILHGIKYTNKVDTEYHGIRTTDLAFRCANPVRILIVMPQTGTEGAYIAAERIREAVMCKPYQSSDGSETLPMTVSASVVKYQADSDINSEALLQRVNSLLDNTKQKENFVVREDKENKEIPVDAHPAS